MESLNSTLIHSIKTISIRDRVIQAGQHEIYVDVMLFEGWSRCETGGTNPWTSLLINNNTNGINGDPFNTGNGDTIRDNKPDAVLAEESLYRKVIDTVGDLDNVL